MTRTGKIARLPRDIRAQLNRRLRDGESGRPILDWLNSLPEVRAVLDRDFAGREINDVNLTEWRQGGYLEWEIQQEALDRAGDLAASAGELTQATQGPLADHLATLLTARYAVELAVWNGEDSDETRRRLRSLRELCHDVVELQRGTHNAARLRIEQARLDRGRERVEEDIAAIFLQWLDYPKVRECALDEAATPKERRDRLKELFRPKPPPSETPSLHSDPLFSSSSGQIDSTTFEI